MIRALFRLHWLGLRRDRQALVFLLVLPIVFFTVMTEIFEEVYNVGFVTTTRLGVLDRDQSEFSRATVATLISDDRFDVEILDAAAVPVPADASERIARIRQNQFVALIEFPQGFGDAFNSLPLSSPGLKIYEDSSNPVAGPLLEGLIQARMMELMFGLARGPAGPTTKSAEADGGTRTYFDIKRIDVFGTHKGQEKSVVVSYSAAGIGVLFLLFAMVGAASTLIDEQDAGTLERLFLAGVSPSTMILCKWLFFAAIGFTQTLAMFSWGWIRYGLDVFSADHFGLFLILTIVTALAASAFGLLLAVLCRTRIQLVGISTVVILVMSALGGSMFPRFLMSEYLQDLGLITFNAWALDGYQKIFWYEATLSEIYPELQVLGGLAALLFLATLVAARRWRPQ